MVDSRDLHRVGDTLNQGAQFVPLHSRPTHCHCRVFGHGDDARLACVAVAIAPHLRARRTNLDAQTVRISDAIGTIAGLQRAQLGISQRVSQPFVSQSDREPAGDSQPDSLLLDSSGIAQGGTDKKTPQSAGVFVLPGLCWTSLDVILVGPPGLEPGTKGL